jgi:spermidine/putrescine transport system ATP-binding protein
MLGLTQVEQGPAAQPPVPADHRCMLELRGLTKAFAGQVAVDGIDLGIGEGEFVSLLGPSGSGKTTTMRMIAGFESPTAGQILLDGRDIRDIPAHRRPVNTVFQDYALFPHLTVAQNVAFGLKAAGVARDEVDRRVREALELVELGPFASRGPGQLSGGQRQRAALARALVLRPRLLLLDEPLGALDLKLRRQMQLVLMELCRQLGTTFLYITHDQEEALTMSDRIAVMNRGRVEQFAAPQELYRHPASSFVAGFVGSNNLLRGRLTARDGERCAVNLGGVRCEVPADTLGAATAGDEVVVALRPECVELTSGGEGGKLGGVVSQTVFVGAEARAIVALDGDAGELVARVSPADLERYARGARVRVDWEPGVAQAFPAPEEPR